jgi:histidyl-tRNA synthetase
LDKNPLRILDDKVDGIKEFVKQSPKISEYLSKESNDNFAQLINLLKNNNINYAIDGTLVRGLDYYTNMVFEIDVDGVVVGGGGRYGKLVSEFGGDDVSCVGMAFGVERVINALEAQNIAINTSKYTSCLFFPLINSANDTIVKYMDYYRSLGVACICNHSINKIAKAFNFAEKNEIDYVVIVGENELNNGSVTVKNVKTSQQTTVDN